MGTNGDTGVQDYQNSYHSKAHSLLAGLILLHELEKFYGIPHHNTRSICDSKGLIHRITNNQPITNSTSEVNILQEIYRYKQISSDFEHVKGHQDTHRSIISDDAYFNVLADLVARTNTIFSKQIHPPNTWITYVQGLYIPHSHKIYLR